MAAAVHDALAVFAPDQTSRVDAALASSQAAIPDGDAKEAGIRAGREAAARTLDGREDDGLDPGSVNRPVTAIRAANTDGDPLTQPDPAWGSYVPTPPNPEYPSGDPAYAGATAQVLEHFTGPRIPAPFTVPITRGDGQVVPHEYRRGTPWSALTQDVVDARLWAGAHFRFSSEAGAVLGRRVADYGLRQSA